jgi:hypothetical protein
MAGPVEEAGKVASGLVTAMGSNPVLLGLVIVILSLIAMVFFTIRAASEARKNEFEMIFTQQKQVQDILSRCVVQPSQRGALELIPLPPLPTRP